MDIKAIQDDLRRFCDARGWAQFHSPKNLSIALAVEASELLERFQWLTEDESRQIAQHPEDYRSVVEELADVMIYLLRLADQLNVDLDQAVAEKMQKNAEKYPIDLARGNAVKYNRRKV